MQEKFAYKVLRQDLTSLGLLGAPRMSYRLNRWNFPQDGLSDHPRKGGGLWVAPSLSAARGMQRYMRRKHGIEVRIFRCRIGRVLHETSCRIKTDKLIFSATDEIR